MTRDGAILRLERERDFSRKMEKSWSQVDWKNRPDHLADPRALSANHRMYADALDMAISALREQPRWISVEERLPEESGRYLVLEKCFGYIVARLASWTHYYDGGEEDFRGRSLWYDYDSEYGDFEVRDITHWMPLPEPPKEEV